MMKTKGIFLLIFAITTVLSLYSIFIVWSYAQYGNYVEEQKTLWIQLKKPIELFEYDAFFTLPLGRNVVLVGCIIIVAIIIIAMKIPRNKLLSALISLMLLVTLSPIVSPSVNAEITPEATVNILIYFDEETMALPSADSVKRWWNSQLFREEPLINTVYENFRDAWNIKFVGLNIVWNEHYESWQSPSSTDAYELLQSGIQEKGGVWDSANNYWKWIPKHLQNGVKMYLADLLIFITAQEMSPQSGFSVPQWNAMLYREEVCQDVVVHELGHQFFCSHCGNWCIMNPSYCGVVGSLCSPCSNVLLDNRLKWGEKIFGVGIYLVGGGYTEPKPNFDYQVILGSAFSIYAYTNSHMYVFAKWFIYHSAQESYYSWDNPLLLVVDKSYVVFTYFTQGSPEGGSFGGGGSGGIKCRR